jgi:monoamine oxidase
MTNTYDAVIVGAGAAGLAAAAELAAAGSTVCLLEARDRLGGRVLTRHEPNLSVPLELGAEFVHGRPAATLEWLARRNVALLDAPESRWLRRRDGMHSGERAFEELRAALKRIARPRKDLPFSEFLHGAAAKRLTPRLREFALMLAEGFDAADATRVSTLGILDEWCGDGAADAPTFRPQHGYASLVDALAGALDPKHVHVQLGTIVREIRWKSGRVSIDATQLGRAVAVAAARAIVTLPLGILQLPQQAPNAVRFVPALTAKQKALAGLATGPVIKVLMHFKRPFWEELEEGRYCNAAFFHMPGGAFPTFWTALPLRAPLVAAWAAGPAAARLSGVGEGEIVRTALECLEAVFAGAREVQECFAGAYLHDWQADPFACGAYSYVVAGGGRARAELAKPLARTLFFAGEAAETDGESGTVAGAIASGRRAARQLLAARAR